MISSLKIKLNQIVAEKISEEFGNVPFFGVFGKILMSMNDFMEFIW
jgi:hypothetical protein